MKLLWADINASYSHSNLAFPAMEAQLPEKSRRLCEWKVVSGTTKSPQEELIMQITNFKPQFIFATGWLFNIAYLTELIEKCSVLMPETRAVLGGPEFLGDNRAFLERHPCISAVFKGEGEEIFPELIERILSGEQSGKGIPAWKELPGVEYICNGDYIRKESIRVKDFKRLVPPEESQFFNWDKPFVQLESSRGCFNGCRFCVSGISDACVEEIECEVVERRLNNILRHGIKEIRLLDRTFNGNCKRAVKLLELFEKFSGRLRFHLEIHPAFINGELAEKFSGISEGLLHVEAGVQSLQEPVIKACNRKGSAEAAFNGLKKLLEFKRFQVHTDLIAGLPEYSYSQLLADVGRLVATGADEIQLELLKVLPGTCFREKSNEFGLKYSPFPPYEVMETPHTEYRELCLAKILSKILEYWYNDPLWRGFAMEAAAREPMFLGELAAFLQKRNFLDTPYSSEGKSILLYDFCKKFHPSLTTLFTLFWVRAGLSLKKEPAAPLRKWHIGENEVPNPHFDASSRTTNYFYLDCEGRRHWFLFDYTIERHKPAKEFSDFLNYGINID